MAEPEGISAEEVRCKVKSGQVLPAFHPCRKTRRLSLIAPDPKKAPLPVRQVVFFRGDTRIRKLWREAWRPGKRPDTLS